MMDTPARPDQDDKRLNDPVEVPADIIEPAPPPPEPQRGWAPPRAGRTVTILTVAFILIGLALVLYAWGLPPFSSAVQTTDNAYVRGQTTVIAPQVSGYVVDVAVQDYDRVTKGQVLARIDDRIYRQRVDQAKAQVSAQIANLENSQQSQRSSEAQLGGQEANVASARAQLARAQADMRRVNDLLGGGSISVRERDQTLAALRQAEAAVRQAEAQRAVAGEQVRTVTVGRGGLRANVEAARAALRLAEIDLANTIIRAPQDGQLGEVGVRLGQYVTAGSQLTFLVPPLIWVSANYKEAQTARMAPGQPVRLSVDALDRAEIKGRVERLAPAAGNEFQVIRSDNATGNFVKVPQRISVRIALDRTDPLYRRMRPGMSVIARIDTTDGPVPRQR
ncbi:multidrug resistance efflux pump [Sphingobium wenxiniae]|uniref:Multidrug resistance efflux pump n=1 Tax=Sphingobium wenxiniae (strain DSM 21828 / CGMCC 1.7748 / JZ-1) TaxID=595605 RepID=A0A562KQH5_SPHWJ|nr:HlyD family secretion protein [Sphingobium wenxiniae]MBB6190160.1 multidrug resistance efflux pump [Sphingobium wenxiniae]TWH97525.1 multidrug resistance efflux pump [Sphingobium wenxiniae]